MITSPIGAIEPGHIGQMFFDSLSQVFYQARGRSAEDWYFVRPADLPGSFVKIYDLFLGPARPATTPESDLAERVADSEAVRETMAMDGVRVLSAFCWKVARGPHVMMARIKFDRVRALSLFAGFDPAARAHAMPDGVGFTFEDGILSFGDIYRVVTPGETMLLRLELDNAVWASAFVNDRPFAQLHAPAAEPAPLVALFDRSRGPRPVARGYERALKRNLAR